ncbi:MAG: class I SAM-dependent methyltransferase, partial [Actinomycetia bacterium]|nr:class I SAM-dependent methyltransferase [Actinomycetes bacterium]
MATSIATAFGRVLGERRGLRLTAYDGSTFGAAAADVTLSIRSPEAVQYLATAPGDLGLARAFVSGSLVVEENLHRGLTLLVLDGAQDSTTRDKLQVLRELGGWVLRRPPLPPEEVTPPWRRGLRHSKERDANAIAHHYDVSNRFYEMVLGPSMTYTCALYPDAGASLETAQTA